MRAALRRQSEKNFFVKPPPCPLSLAVFLCAHGDRRSDRRRGSKDEAFPFLMPKGIERQKDKKAGRYARDQREDPQAEKSRGRNQGGIRKNRKTERPLRAKREKREGAQSATRNQNRKRQYDLNQKNFFCKRSPVPKAENHDH